jgi:hypothetical protein
MSQNKKGDILDGMFYFGKMGNDPEHFTHYPERVIGTLRLLYKTFNIPEGGIPNRKQKSNFEEWILQLDELNAVAPSQEKMKKAMNIAKGHYDNLNKKFMIIRPASIKGLLINAVRTLNDEEKSSEEFKVQPVEKVEVASAEAKKKTLKNLKSILKEDDD